MLTEIAAGVMSLKAKISTYNCDSALANTDSLAKADSLTGRLRRGEAERETESSVRDRQEDDG